MTLKIYLSSMNFEVLNKTLSAKNIYECKNVQYLVRELIEFRDVDISLLNVVAGVDLSYKGDIGICVLVVFDFKTMDILEQVVTVSKVSFPYIPGFLAFREVPLIVDSINRLSVNVDLFIVDGQGVAHPRKAGIATHLGVILEKPTVGCAKSLLYGCYIDPINELNATTDLVDPVTNEVIGKVVRTKVSTKPIFVSVGNYINLEKSVEIVKRLTFNGKYRIPLPTFIADKLSKEERKKVIL
jgi:deoxyribonuclease V